MALTAGDIRFVFAVAAIPALLAVAVLAWRVPSSPMDQDRAKRPVPIRLADLGRLGRGVWLVTGVAAALGAVRFGEAFLVLRAHDLGLALALVPLALVALNLAYTISAAPAGDLADRVDRRWLLAAGLLCLVAADLALAMNSLVMAFVGIGLWGLHLGLTQGLLSAWIADLAPADRRGSAFGMFHLIGGLGLLVGGAGAGLIWSVFGPGALFVTGAGLAAAMVPLVAALPRPARTPAPVP